MQLVFTKGPGKYDRMEVVRADGAVERIDCPKQRIIPHDMVHYAVESTLAKRGFLTRVQEGAPADFRMQPEAESDGVERLVEVFQGDAWSGGASSAAVMLDLYRVTCAERECPMLAVTEADVDAIRARIAEPTAQWDALSRCPCRPPRRQGTCRPVTPNRRKGTRFGHALAAGRSRFCRSGLREPPCRHSASLPR